MVCAAMKHCPTPSAGASFLYADVVGPAGPSAQDVRIGEQRIVLGEAGETVATLVLHDSDATGNALYWPAVPVAYTADAVGLGVAGAVYGAAFVAAVVSFVAVAVVVAPMYYLGEAVGPLLERKSSPQPPPDPPSPPEPSPAGGSP